MIKVLIMEEADGYNQKDWEEADIVILVNSTSVDDDDDPEIRDVVVNRPTVMRKDMAEAIAEAFTNLVGV